MIRNRKQRMDQTRTKSPETPPLCRLLKNLVPEIHCVDAQKELYRFQHRVAEANAAIVPEPSYTTHTPKGKMSDVLVAAMDCQFIENVAGNRSAGNMSFFVYPESTALF
jgi:hypothetical protein